MAKDLYDILDIPENAPAEMIARAYQIKRAAVEGNMALAKEEKREQLVILKEAFNTLSNPNLRSSYDGTLLSKKEAASGIGENRNWQSHMRTFVILAMIVGGIAFVVVDYRKEQQAKAERERVAQEEAQLQKKIAEEAENKRIALEKERAEREQAEQERLEKERSERAKFLASRTFEADTAAINNMPQKVQEREMQEKKRAMEEDANRRRALADLERQKRFLRESQR